MSDIYLSLTETPSVVTLSQPVVASVMVNTVTVANVVSVNVVTMPAINVTAAVSGGLSNAELRASAVSVAVTTMPALSISSVSISNFPATQTIAGTVTANVEFDYISGADCNGASDKGVLIGWRASNDSFKVVDNVTNQLPISGTVTANIGNYYSAVTVSGANAGLAGGLAGTTVTVFPVSIVNSKGTGGGDLQGYNGTRSYLNVGIQNIGNTSLASESSLPISGTVTVGNSVTIAGTVTANLGDIGLYDDGGDAIKVNIFAYGNPSEGVTTKGLPIFGTVTVGNSVTIGSLPTLTPQLPRVTFIDGSGTVVTANSAVTLFASSSTRSYLLVQVTTGSAFVNVGATATTLNGISLTAGQGYAWETTIPQGAVSLISTTTNSAYVAKQA